MGILFAIALSLIIVNKIVYTHTYDDINDEIFKKIQQELKIVK